MTPPHFILYVADQARSTGFYRRVLEREPRLDVPGMTEFDLGGAVLGLMPEAGIQRLIPIQATYDGTSRCELYLPVGDAQACLLRALDAGATLLDPVVERSWGDHVGYCLDLDGHVLAFAAS